MLVRPSSATMGASPLFNSVATGCDMKMAVLIDGCHLRALALNARKQYNNALIEDFLLLVFRGTNTCFGYCTMMRHHTEAKSFCLSQATR